MIQPATIIFDFDSTLINCESLERIMAESHKLTPEKLEEINRICDASMNGVITFIESLNKRLKLCNLSEKDIEIGAEKAKQWVSAGMHELVANLHKAKHDVWIMSGGLRQILLSVGSQLGILPERIHGVELTWHQGVLQEPSSNHPFNISKVLGAQSLITQFSKRPVIMVGDGYNDFEVFRGKVADHFIVYTEHARRERVLQLGNDLGCLEAKNCADLERHLEDIFQYRHAAK